MNPTVRLCCLLILASIGLTGCSQYQPLSGYGEPVSIAVLPVANESELPQVIAPLARNLREKIAHSPNWNLVSPEAAAASLQVTVTGPKKRAMARDPRDTGRPLSFYEEVRVTVQWISSLPPPWGPDPVLVVTDDQILYAQPSQVDSRTSAIPATADRLAEKIVQSLDWSGPVSSN